MCVCVCERERNRERERERDCGWVRWTGEEGSGRLEENSVFTFFGSSSSQYIARPGPGKIGGIGSSENLDVSFIRKSDKDEMT